VEDRKLKVESGKNVDMKALWLKLFKKNFKFVGGEIVGEFLMSIDMLPGSHGKECERYSRKNKE
jgi:DNA-3-methyladenine glycosylase I